MSGWPFTAASREQFDRLSADQKRRTERVVAALIEGYLEAAEDGPERAALRVVDGGGQPRKRRTARARPALRLVASARPASGREGA